MAALIAYFSRAGENYFSGTLRTVSTGNTELVARKIAQETGAPLFRIDPLCPYARDYNTCIEEAQNDQRRDARPELKSYPDSIAPYDDIYLGFPNYWGTMPMPVFTFLEHFDFSGKTIHPFCTHEGSGLGRSLSDIQQLCPRAVVAPALTVSGTHASQASPQVRQWLTQQLHDPSTSHPQHKII